MEFSENFKENRGKLEKKTLAVGGSTLLDDAQIGQNLIGAKF
jgi:hypothetical protein